MTPSPPRTTALRLAVDGPIGRVTLARPEKLNALSRVLLEELTEAASWFDDQPAVKVVVVSGEGRSFCAGFDLIDPSWSEPGSLAQSAETGRAMAESIGSMQAITVASIRGSCIGGGVVIASACDLRIASAAARFRIPEAELGIPLFWTGVPRLTRELGPALTKELILTARWFDAEEARSVRFVNRVVSDDALAEETDGLAAELAAKPALALRTTKQQVEAAAPPVPTLDPGSAADVAAFGAALHDSEGQTVAAAYLRSLTSPT